MATTKLTTITTAAQAKTVLASLVKASDQQRDKAVMYGEWIAYCTLLHGNKQPLELAESSGLPKYMVQALKRCILPQQVDYRDKQDEGREVAREHAEKIFGIVMDKVQDNSEAAKKRRADAKKKRDDEKARIAALELDNARMKAQLGENGAASGPAVQSKGGMIVSADNKRLDLTEEEYQAALAAIEALRGKGRKPRAA